MAKVFTFVLRYKSHLLLGGAFAIGVLLVAFSVGKPVMHRNIPLGDTSVPTTTEQSILQGPALNDSQPVRLEIPKLSIDTTFTPPLGLDEKTGEVVVPGDYEQVGWYKYGPTPGEYGPSVILGHVDSYTGPAVFFYLGQLSEGDDIFITREDGSKAAFKVTVLERYEQSDFPTEKVYGNIDHAGLRLVTCSGTYDREKARYTQNLVVYARLVE